MLDVVLFDLDRAYCPPALSAPVGGSEVELYQLAEAFQRAGLTTELVLGKPTENLGACETLIYWRQVEPVPWCQPNRRIVRATDNPPQGAKQVDGMTTVCVSKWQAAKYETPTLVVPPMLGAHVYETKWAPIAGNWIYASAANKGIRETIAAWRSKKRDARLLVTTTGYDEPEVGLCEREIGVWWLGKLTPLEMVRRIARCEGMFYRNVAPETFGVTTAIAASLGLALDIECAGHDACGLAESRVPQDLTERATVERWMRVLR